MADNYVHTPILNMTLLASGTVTAGHFLKGAKSGFANADGIASTIGIRALADATSGNKFPACVIGAGWCKVADCVIAGEALVYSDTGGVLTRVTDTAGLRNTVAISLDGPTAAVTTMTNLCLWNAIMPLATDSANRVP